MMSQLLRYSLLAAALLTFVGCDAKSKHQSLGRTDSSSAAVSAPAKPAADQAAVRRQLALSQLTELDGQRYQLVSRLNQQRNNVTELEQAITRQTRALRNYEVQVNSYLLDHKMAVACIAAGAVGGSVALDRTGRFSQEAKDISGGVAVIAALYALANAKEIYQVAKVITEADANYKQAEANLAAAQSRLQQERRALNTVETNHRQLTLKINQLRRQLQA
ncbi:hypothetical protein [Actomonas aquatica]|uniref:Lipoprotein n=1 Tax=Actomonas aquatica TaxID=2866162 RepID=A0ABZ1C7Z8_9BACT|nr:hypothetical protein [Opitutus sp. WL0086]WRQ86664.1 hypothetical protein K1X11_017770 [Opitutus sp. WL0086]